MKTRAWAMLVLTFVLKAAKSDKRTVLLLWEYILLERVDLQANHLMHKAERCIPRPFFFVMLLLSYLTEKRVYFFLKY